MRFLRFRGAVLAATAAVRLGRTRFVGRNDRTGVSLRPRSSHGRARSATRSPCPGRRHRRRHGPAAPICRGCRRRSTFPPASVARVEVVTLETEPVADRRFDPNHRTVGHGMGPFRARRPNRSSSPAPASSPSRWQRSAPRAGSAAVTSPTYASPRALGRREPRARARDPRRVRLHLESDTRQPLMRERIPEWEATDRRPCGADRSAAVGRVRRRKHSGFSATQIPSVLGSPVQYVIITNDALAAEFQRLADWKTQSGVPAVVRTLSFIQQQYPSGLGRRRADPRLHPRRLRALGHQVGAARRRHRASCPRATPAPRYYGGEDIACDMYFSCLDGNWNADGDRIYGEGILGESEPGDAVDLLPRGVRRPRAGGDRWRTRSSSSTRRSSTRGRRSATTRTACCSSPRCCSRRTGCPATPIAARRRRSWSRSCCLRSTTNPDMRYARLYQNYTDPAGQPGALHETREAVIDSLNLGYNISVHVGHGYRNVMSVGDGNLNNADALGAHQRQPAHQPVRHQLHVERDRLPVHRRGVPARAQRRRRHQRRLDALRLPVRRDATSRRSTSGWCSRTASPRSARRRRRQKLPFVELLGRTTTPYRWTAVHAAAARAIPSCGSGPGRRAR